MERRSPAWGRWIAQLLILCIIGSAVLLPFDVSLAQDAPVGSVNEAEMSTEALPNGIEWLEPQGINVVDLVGAVPESHLRDTIISFTVPGGVLQYIEGRRAGDTVTIRAKVWPRFETYNWTRFNCISLRAVQDHWATTQPPGTVRIYDGEREITDQIIQFDYFDAGLIQPAYAAERLRYRERWYADEEFTDDGAFVLPANMGCTITLDGIWDSGNLTAVYTLNSPKVITVKTVGQQTFSFRSYIGPGYSGEVAALQKQLERYGKRHDKFDLKIPAEADYVLVNYPPSPVSPYVVGDVARNILNPSSGTYRLARGAATLSIDHNITMGLPIRVQWQDADQAGDTFLKRIEGINTIAALEYFVPEGVGYDPCMQVGGCPEPLMQAILNAQMEMTVYYYNVSRVRDGLVRVPLRQVGPEYSVSGQVYPASDWNEVVPSVGLWPRTTTFPPSRIFLPVLSQPFNVDNLPPDNPDDCPCGWFTADGRMVDIIPEQP